MMTMLEGESEERLTQMMDKIQKQLKTDKLLEKKDIIRVNTP